MAAKKQLRSLADTVDEWIVADDRGEPTINVIDMMISQLAAKRDELAALGSERALYARCALAERSKRQLHKRLTERLQGGCTGLSTFERAQLEKSAKEGRAAGEALARWRQIQPLVMRVWAAMPAPPTRDVQLRQYLVESLQLSAFSIHSRGDEESSEVLAEQEARALADEWSSLGEPFAAIGGRLARNVASVAAYLLAAQPGRPRRKKGETAAATLAKVLAAVGMAASRGALKSARQRARARRGPHPG